MKAKLDYIESRLQALIENTVKLFNRETAVHPLAHQLVAAMRDSVILARNGRIIAPDVYTILVNPEDLPAWQANAGLQDSLAQILIEAAQESGVSFLESPVIRLLADPAVPPKHIKVNAVRTDEKMGTTAVLQIMTEQPREEKDPRPASAFLIVDGAIFPLRLVVVNIGRRLDNHLVIDDPRVSRAHAQLRAVHGRYVLFDLNSTGGTYVNGQRISQHSLKAGDVISLSGVPVIYGEDTPSDETITGADIQDDANSHTAPMG
jgi:pSer/pThr/pTyr-binding forkhead associated (FHA) protein